MRKQQFIHLLQFVFAWVLIRAFVVFVMEESFVDFVLKYWLYFLIVSISYFYYYSIQYEPDKKYELIRNVLIYGNAYLFLHMFFRPQLNISHQLFVLLWLIALWVWWTTKLKTRWKYLLQIIGWIFSFFILISGMFYFYPEAPDIDWFIKSRGDKILFMWIDEQVDKKEAYIQLLGQKWTINLDIVPNFSRELSESQKISYPAIEKQRDEKIVIISSYWDLIQIFPQSEIQVEFDWNTFKRISKLNWRIWFLSWVFDSNIEISWYEQELSEEYIDFLKWIQNSYKSELVFYLKNQISKNNMWLANNTIMYNIDGKIVRFLAKMFPITFGKNLQNYNEFQRYFSWFDEKVDLSRYDVKDLEESWWGKKSLRWYIKENMGRWKGNMYGWLKKPEKR